MKVYGSAEVRPSMYAQDGRLQATPPPGLASDLYGSKSLNLRFVMVVMVFY